MEDLEAILQEYIKRIRPPKEIRPKLDLSYTIEGQSVYINEVRPRNYDPPSDYRAIPNVKFTYVKSKKVWKIFWMRQDLKWHSYTPAKVVDTIEEALEIYDEDKFYCFKG